MTMLRGWLKKTFFKKKWVDDSQSMRIETAVDAIYHALLRRDPDSLGKKYYTGQIISGELNFENVVNSLLNSDEFQASPYPFAGSAWKACTQAMAEPSDHTLTKQLQGDKSGWQWFENLWGAIMPTENDMIIGQKDYLTVHKCRFFELTNAVEALLPEGGNICEFGVTEFSRIYKHLYPDCVLVTVDRPVSKDYPGFTPKRCQQITNCDKHITLDLEYLDSPEWQNVVSWGPYDVIIFTEVLEHLLVAPVQLISQLVSLLSPNGYLYLTTPNFFRQANLKTMAAGRNPQPFYPDAGQNWDAHYHFREYAMPELTDIVQQGGGKVIANYFSGCWDDPEDSYLNAHPQEKANIVIVAGKQKELYKD